MEHIKRCNWTNNNPLLIEYHDKEWGVPLHDDNKLFEFIVLDTFQAGLSWAIILNKREGMRQAFDNFQPEKIALYDDKKVEDLLKNTSIIRNRMKINATIKNARAFLKIKSKYDSFNNFIWQFTAHKTINNNWKSISEIPAHSNLSDKVSKELYNNGFTFVGTTICYAFLQAIGVINDHIIDCFRYSQIIKLQK